MVKSGVSAALRFDLGLNYYDDLCFIPLTSALETGSVLDWVLVAHVGIIGHDRIMISCAKPHYSNQGIKENGAVSLTLVSEAMLPKADFAGSVSGHNTDKSEVFSYLIGDYGAPMIEEAPLVMEGSVEDIYDSDHFDNFILKIQNTYAEPSVLGENGKVDDMKIKPVLFDMPNYEYIRTGEVIGDCLKFGNRRNEHK